MHELPFLQSLFALLFAGKFLTALKFLCYRIASWLGIGFFWKKGKDSGQKKFYWVSFLITGCQRTWAGHPLLCPPKVWRWVIGWFRREA